MKKAALILAVLMLSGFALGQPPMPGDSVDDSGTQDDGDVESSQQNSTSQREPPVQESEPQGFTASLMSFLSSLF